MYTMTVFKDEKKDFSEWNALYGLLLKSKTQAVVKRVIDKVSGEHLILILILCVLCTLHCVLCTHRWCGMRGLGSVDILNLHCLDIQFYNTLEIPFSLRMYISIATFATINRILFIC
jgi:hypothetical protein